MPLSDYLRYELCAVGTKVVCAEGDCGACTVLLGRVQEETLCYKPVNSCIQYLYQLDGCHIVTVEGLKLDGEPNAVQEAMMACHGAQCGYCTPGFVVTMCGLFDAQPAGWQATERDIREALTGNLCRCTGYEPIIQAGLTTESSRVVRLHQLYPSAEISAAFRQSMTQSVRVEGANFQGEPRLAFVPTTVEEAVRLKAEHPGSMWIQGGTDISVICNKRGFEPAVVISLANLPAEIREIYLDNNHLHIGAAVSLMQLQTFVQTSLSQLREILETFGGPQIKYAGTLAGNIANGSPIGDTIPWLMVMNAEVEVQSLQGTRRINMNGFYLGYKKLALKPDELITKIICPLPGPQEILKLYKISKRKHLDISIFTAAILLKTQAGKIESARLAMGGVGPVVQRLAETEAFLTDKPLTEATFIEAGKIARAEVAPISDVRGSAEYRLQLAENILRKCFYEISTPEPAGVPV